MPRRMGVNRRMPALRLLSLLVLLGLPGCTWLLGKAGGAFAKKLPKDNRTGKAKVVGVIDMVNPEQQYVLINCEQRLNLPAGTEIIAQNADGSKATLKVTPERKGNYITADIKEGVPQVKDIVLYQLKPGDLPPPPAAPGTTPAAATPLSEQMPAVPLTPVMQADVIPPLDTPFQPMAPVRTAPQPAPAPAPRYLVPAPSPAPAPAPKQQTSEPEFDPSGLPPVVR